MHRDLLKLLRCPARDCEAAGLSLKEEIVDEIAYRTGTMEEIREGSIACRQCGRVYPINDYVPSFEQLFPTELQEEARYWDDWYGFFWDRGYKGFFDVRAPAAHLIARGIEVADPNSLSGNDLAGTHQTLDEHPLVSAAERILDIGCGCGWSSLYLARRGHKVVALDPSVGNVRRAKQYAISQGEYIEYLAAGLGFLAFEPEVFDGAFALHSIHHVPNLGREVAIMRGWLRDEGVIAVDEHVQTDPTLNALVAEIERWFTTEVGPKYITIGPEEMAALPRSAHSRMEDAGSTEVLSALADNFCIETFDCRFVSLDIFSFMYYLRNDCDRTAYDHAGEIISRLYSFMQGAYPERVEYITLVGRKHEGPGPASGALARTMSLVSEKKEQAELVAQLRPFLSPEQIANVERMGAELEAASDAAKHLQAAYDETHDALSIVQDTLVNLNDTIHAKNDHIAHLESVIAHHESEIATKQAALDDQEEILRKLPIGLLIRIANRLGSGKGKPR